MRHDPVRMMLEIAAHFIDQAVVLDQHVADAIQANANADNITRLMDLSAGNRMRALAAAQAAAPFCSPKLTAVEVASATPVTQSRFEDRLEKMTEGEVTAHLKAIAAGTLTLEAIDADADEEAFDADK